MPLICFMKGNFCLFVLSNVMFSLDLNLGRLLYCETINLSILSGVNKLSFSTLNVWGSNS